jgi:hypothetical protein
MGRRRAPSPTDPGEVVVYPILSLSVSHSFSLWRGRSSGGPPCATSLQCWWWWPSAVLAATEVAACVVAATTAEVRRQRATTDGRWAHHVGCFGFFILFQKSLWRAISALGTCVQRGIDVAHPTLGKGGDSGSAKQLLHGQVYLKTTSIYLSITLTLFIFMSSFNNLNCVECYDRPHLRTAPSTWLGRAPV